MEDAEDARGDGGELDADTEEFSNGELASEHGDEGADLKLPWGRLVSVDKTYSNIELSEKEVRLGRSDVLKANGQEDLHVSKLHCKIWESAEDGLCHVQNLSVNGTLVQGKLLEIEQEAPLLHGDEVSLGPYTSGCPVYVFQRLSRATHGNQKREMEVDANMGSDPSENETANANDPKRLKMMQSLDTLKCSICWSVWHDVVSVSPCLHSFCNSCFSSWYRTSCRERNECKCPQRRGRISCVSRNHTLRSLVEDLLKGNPSLGRCPEDLAELDKISLFKNDAHVFEFGKIRHSSQNDADGPRDLLEEDDEDGDEENETCFQCFSQTGSFQCGPEQRHLICYSCGFRFPEREESLAQKCQVCSRAFCRTYVESQDLSDSYNRQNGHLWCPKILPLSQREVTIIPGGTTHYGNAHEQEVTRQYIDEHHLSVTSIVREWLRRLDSGEADRPPHLLVLQREVTSSTTACDSCADEIFGHLLNKFRLSVPKSELPPDAAARDDCWYGYECRTQHHKEGHARKLNHVCEPTRHSRGDSVVRL